MNETVTGPLFVGIDVGTGSARAGIFNRSGKMLAAATQAIQMWRPETDFVEQSSDDIWQACCLTVQMALADSGAHPTQVKGIGFDATCSLVALDASDQPVTISPSNIDAQNVIVWMDHRALKQTDHINELGHDVLKYVGGRISPEMQSPKLLWLRENLPQTWERATQFFDLPDLLTYRATGCNTRSLCSTVCKWTYLGHESNNNHNSNDSVGKWDESYWQAIGLEEFVADNFQRIGQNVRPMGEPLANGLTQEAAEELGLQPGTPVGVSIIDAHAGGLGLLGAPLDNQAPTLTDLDHRLALIGGTSTCHMAVSPAPRYIDGIWGPYYSAMIPDLWLTEGGQSATGSLIDHIIFTHHRSKQLQKSAQAQDNTTVYDLLNERLDKLASTADFPAHLTQELHVLPYFHGNRSPRADATLRGAISGLRLTDSLDELALLYLATIQAIAQGTRHIIQSLNESGYQINTMLACGGGTKNRIFLREHADITGCRIVLPQEPEAVLLGSAILGATASGEFNTVLEAMAALSGVGQIIEPSTGPTKKYHDAKYRIFLQMYQDQLNYRKLMQDA